MNAIKVIISYDKDPNTEESFALKELRTSLEESNISVEAEIEQKGAGVKDGGLMLALTIAGLALSAVGTLISAISLWGSKRNYSISFESGGATFVANNLSAKETLTIAQAIKERALDVKVLVSRL